jgi:ABC-type antimicrobial peptide transport system permease subunit
MGPLRLLLAGLRHQARVHLGVMLGAAVASGVLVGALAVGDSVRFTLGQRAAARVGSVDAAIAGGDRFFRDALADELAGSEAVRGAAPIVQLPAVASTPRGDRRVLDARVLGVDARFMALAPAGPAAATGPGPREAFLGAPLAERLGVAAGDTVVLRVEQPSAVPRDLALSPDDNTAALRVTVKEILSDARFGAFALDASPTPPANALVDLAWLQEQLELGGTANLMLLSLEVEDPLAMERATARLGESWQLADAALEVTTLDSGERELTSTRIFLDEPVVEVLDGLGVAPLTGVFTYFVDWLRVGGAPEGAGLPYSMVSALGPIGSGETPDGALLSLSRGIPRGGLRLGSWALADLAASGVELRPQSEVELEYHVVDASRRLVTRKHTFAFAGAAPEVPDALGELGPLEGTVAGEELMPDFPGLADADSCREWEPGTPVDLDAIRPQDEQYWDDFRGTPKAFMNLDDARELWASRFGALTSVRFDAEDEDAVLEGIRGGLDPAQVGLFLVDVGGAARRSSESPTDFGGLFIGLSFFLIAAALLLTAQLFYFGVEARERELGLLASLGFAPRRIVRLLLGEVALVGGAGALLGIPLGLAYTRGVLRGLDGLWSDAVASQTIDFHVTGASAFGGAAGALLAVLAAAWIGLRRAARRSPAQLLASRPGAELASAAPRPGRTYLASGLLAIAALGAAVTVDPAAGPAASGAFFGAGGALLAAGLLLARLWLRGKRGGAGDPLGSVSSLGVTNATRRAGRSLGTVALMAIGVFLVLSVGVNRLGPPADTARRDSGTGGFAFYGRTSLPLLHDLTTVEGLDFFGLTQEELEGAAVVRMRARDGDDASCLNLSRPAAPPLLGVDPAALASRGAFAFAKAEAHGDGSPWDLLKGTFEDGSIPAIGDQASLMWQLKVGLGDTLDYVDERGQAFRVRIVGALADSVLQGELVISTANFEARYPSQGGYRRFLVDAPSGRAAEVRGLLTSALGDVGLELQPTGDRLQAFHAVQNTYLSIFQLLGALGLLLGSVGLGLVVLRNTQERRGELALLQALGFRRARLRRLALAEYGRLLLVGLGVGVVASLLAVVPLLGDPTADAPLFRLVSLAGVIFASGLLWIVLAIRLAADREPAAGLRAD